MYAIALIPATLLTAVWLVLLGMVRQEDWVAAAYNAVLDNRLAIDRLRRKDAENQERLRQYHDPAAGIMKLFLGCSSEKKIAKLQRANEQLQRGELKSLSVFPMPGYVLLRKFDSIGRGNVHKKVFAICQELYGKKHAENKTNQLIAKLLSYPMIGLVVPLALGPIAIAIGNTLAGVGILGIGTVLVLVLAYAMYDEVNDQAAKRRAAISRQFPNTVSKLALLVTSGMIMDRAWRETAYSQDLELYREMQRTAEELDNLVKPEAAYGGFINRCNTKETAKLASAIIQNMSKGNAEIGRLLQEMAKEAWLERRHMAKRDSEKANSRLMIPTMLLFLAILVMLMVPVAINFSSL